MTACASKSRSADRLPKFEEPQMVTAGHELAESRIQSPTMSIDGDQ